MPRLSPIRAKEFITFLSKQGFIPVRQKGSHVRMEHRDGRKTSVPIHSSEQIGRGLLRKILRDINVSLDEFRKLR